MGYYDLAKLKPLIRSMVMSHRNKTVSIQELQRDFQDIEGFPIPYVQLGFSSVFQLLHSIPDIVQVSTKNGIPVVTYVSNPATEHVEQLIQRSCNRRRAGRNTYVRYSPNENRFRSNTPKMQRFEQNCPAGMEIAAQPRPNAATKPCVMVMKDDSSEKFEAKVRSPPKQPTAKESNANLDETCEHVDGSVMSWKPYSDMWNSVNMIDLPPDVMTLSHTIPKADVSHYFAENGETHVRILHVLNPNRIWLRSVLQDKTLELLHMQMQECYRPAVNDNWSLEASKVQHGLYCAALFDQIWLRARIVGPLIGSHVKVFYIDTGLMELVDYKCIKLLFTVFSGLPAQAIRASLACLIPKDNAWTRDESERLSASLTSGQNILKAYTLNINHKLGILDIILKDANMFIINEHFASQTNAQWTGAFYLSHNSAAYRNKRRSFNEKHPSFFCIEEGHFPTIGELRNFLARNFDYEELYTRLPHFDNGIVEKISRATNEKMVKLHGIVSAND